MKPLTARVTARLTDAIEKRWREGYATDSAKQQLIQLLVAAIAPDLQDAEAEIARLKDALYAAETKLIREWSHRESHQP